MNREQKGEVKLPGEKLVCVTLTTEGDIISSIRISGDFFIYPEDGLEKIERALIEYVIEDTAVRECVESVIDREHLVPVGISSASIAYAIKEALQ